MKKKSKAILISSIFVLVLIILLILAYFLFFYSRTCSDKECFDSALERCQRAHFIKTTTESKMQYSIEGKRANNCLVKVNLIKINQGNQELSKLEGKSMICSILYGSKQDPISNIEDCHGLLKEEIQEIIIKRMHSQIIENLEQIQEETTKVL